MTCSPGEILNLNVRDNNANLKILPLIVNPLIGLNSCPYVLKFWASYILISTFRCEMYIHFHFSVLYQLSKVSVR